MGPQESSGVLRSPQESSGVLRGTQVLGACRYERLWELGKAFGLQHVGLQALASLRMEKGYRDYGHDMDNTDRILESGLAFTCDFDKPGGFIGKEATLKHKLDATGGKGTGALNLAQRLVLFKLLDPDAMMFHGEVLWRDGKRVGDVRAAAFGHTIGACVGIAHVRGEPFVTAKWLQEGEWHVEVAERRYRIALSLKPFYDPTNQRIRC
jgi:glycine cleavage system aminomethyltransferase T